MTKASVAKGTGLLMLGLMLGAAGSHPSPQQSALTKASSPQVLAATDKASTQPVTPSPSFTPTPTPRPTSAPTPIQTPKPTIAARAVYQAPKTPTPAPASNCDPNYSGGCVPIASDVDCGGGSGNGPAYFYGTAKVVGVDKYGLDGDHDGWACE
jgi:hypothetical protein